MPARRCRTVGDGIGALGRAGCCPAREDLMTLELSAEERDFLVDLLDEDLRDLKMEIADTDSFAFKQRLKARERVLIGLLQRLDQSAPV
jgi:hypothetical protein